MKIEAFVFNVTPIKLNLVYLARVTFWVWHACYKWLTLFKWHVNVKWQVHSFQVEISPAVRIEKTNIEMEERGDIFETSDVFDTVL